MDSRDTVERGVAGMMHLQKRNHMIWSMSDGDMKAGGKAFCEWLEYKIPTIIR